MMVIHYTKQNNGNMDTPVTLEHVMEWIEKYNRPNKGKGKSKGHIKITSEELI